MFDFDEVEAEVLTPIDANCCVSGKQQRCKLLKGEAISCKSVWVFQLQASPFDVWRLVYTLIGQGDFVA